MENIIYLGGESTSTQEDLPWLKDWSKGQSNPDIAKEVISVHAGDKGLLLQTGEYKSFVFKRESTYKFLMEALETWVRTKMETHPLIISSNPKGKALYGLHQDKPKVKWTFDDGKYTSFRIDGKDTWMPPTRNPFLPSDSPAQQEPLVPPQSQAKAKKSQSATPTEAGTLP